MSTKTNTPIATIQILRAVAALLVLWAHAIDLASVRHLDAIQISTASLENFGAVGVDIFFVISGFIVSSSAMRHPSPGRFLRRRAWRIWPPYALATLLVYILVHDGSARSMTDLAGLSRSLVFVQTPGHRQAMPVHPLGWSLMFEVVFYLIVAAALCWHSPRPLHERILIILTGLLLTGALAGFPQPLNIIGNPVALEFGGGVALSWVLCRKPILHHWIPAALLIAGSTLLIDTAISGFGLISEAEFTLDASASWLRVRTWGLPAMLLVASAILRPAIDPGLGQRWLVHLGNASYSIYLYGYPGLILIDRWGWDHIHQALGTDAAILAAVALAIASGLLAHWLIERPLLKQAGQILQ